MDGRRLLVDMLRKGWGLGNGLKLRSGRYSTVLQQLLW